MEIAQASQHVCKLNVRILKEPVSGSFSIAISGKSKGLDCQDSECFEKMEDALQPGTYKKLIFTELPDFEACPRLHAHLAKLLLKVQVWGKVEFSHCSPTSLVPRLSPDSWFSVAFWDNYAQPFVAANVTSISRVHLDATPHNATALPAPATSNFVVPPLSLRLYPKDCPGAGALYAPWAAHIQTLHLDGLPKGEFIFPPALRKASFRVLVGRDSADKTQRLLSALPRTLRDLRLCINGSWRDERLSFQFPPTLSTLSLTFTYVTIDCEELQRSLARCTQLETLQFNYLPVRNIDDFLYGCLQGMPRLRVLTLRNTAKPDPLNILGPNTKLISFTHNGVELSSFQLSHNQHNHRMLHCKLSDTLLSSSSLSSSSFSSSRRLCS